MDTTPDNAWADKYDNETLELAYSRSFDVARDPSHMFDTEWHAKMADNRARILAELQRRMPTEYA